MDDAMRRLMTVNNVIRGVQDDAVESTEVPLKTSLMYINSDLGVDASLGSESQMGTNIAPPVSTIYGVSYVTYYGSKPSPPCVGSLELIT